MLKIISYNISTCQQWKVDKLLERKFDVLVVPEISCPEQCKIPDEYEFVWCGIHWEYKGCPQSKGLGVIWKKGEGRVPDWYNPKLSYAIPLIIKGVLVLGFWPTKKTGGTETRTYPQIAQELIAEYGERFKEHKTVIIGDYNCYVNQFDKTKQYGDMLRIDEILRGYGLQSAYHKVTDEALGHESKATYYHTFQEAKPFFIDYAYTDAKVLTCLVHNWDKGMSDHCCLEVEIEEPEEHFEYDEQKLKQLIERCTWTFAKTMPTCPHEYIVRRKCALTDEEFLYFVHAQRKYGVPQKWWKYNFPYLHIGGYKYWTMGDTFDNTIIINRAKEV